MMESSNTAQVYAQISVILPFLLCFHGVLIHISLQFIHYPINSGMLLICIVLGIFNTLFDLFSLWAKICVGKGLIFFF